MNTNRNLRLVVKVPKPRNPVIELMRQCKGGKMQKSPKQLRKLQNQKPLSWD